MINKIRHFSKNNSESGAFARLRLQHIYLTTVVCLNYPFCQS
jgi:hypothetical protein